MTASSTIRPTQPTASQNRMPRGFLTRGCSDSAGSVLMDDTISPTAAIPGIRSDSSRSDALDCWSSRSSGIGHSLVTRGSTIVKMKSTMNCSTT